MDPLARVSGVLGALVWFVGAPLVALAGTIPSDAEYFWMGAVGAILGLALAPVIMAISGTSPTGTRAIVRASGFAVCAALAVSGSLMILAADGRLGNRAPSWVPGSADIVLVALFAWIGLASFALRGPSAIDRAVFWLGILTAASFLIPILASILLTSITGTFVFSLPFFIADLVMWVALPVWLTAIVVRLWPESAAHKRAMGRPS